MLHPSNEQWWHLYHTSKDQNLPWKKTNQTYFTSDDIESKLSTLLTRILITVTSSYLWPYSNHSYKLEWELVSTSEGLWRAILQEWKSLKCFQPNHRKTQPLCSKDNILKLITQLLLFGNWKEKLSKSSWSLTQSNLSNQRVNNMHATVKKLIINTASKSIQINNNLNTQKY